MKQRSHNNSHKKPKQSEHYVESYRVESDQKELIIGKLRKELQSLKKNQNDFYALREQYQMMQRKYKILQEEKINQDREFKGKHESSVKHVGQLKNEIEALRGEIRDKKLQIGDMETDSNTLKNCIDQRNIELERYRGEISGMFADTDELESERTALVRTLEEIKRSNTILKTELSKLAEQNSITGTRLADMENYLEQLGIEGKLLKEKITNYQDENNKLDNEIMEVSQDIGQLETEIYESQIQINNVQGEMAELTADSQKFKSQAFHNQKAAQGEVLKNNDIARTIKQSEHILGVRRGQAEEGRKQIESILEQNDNLQKINAQLQQDLESCRRHLENLGLLNSQLVNNLETFSQEDDSVRQMINRKEKVQYMKGRANEVSSTFKTMEKVSAWTQSTRGSRISLCKY